MPVRTGTISSALFWMFLLSILLFWLPVIGPLIAGFVGGRKAGSLGNAIVAAILPSILFGVILFFFSTMLVGLPLIGLIAGAGGAMIALVHVGPLLLGAIIGTMV